MKIFPTIFAGSAVLMMLNACTTTSKLTGSSTDDVYNTTAQAKEIREPQPRNQQTYSEDGQQDYAYVPDSTADYSGGNFSPDASGRTVYNDELAYNDGYYDDDLYYSSRINRFYNNRNFGWRGYYDPFYSSFYDPFGYGGFNSAYNWGRPGFGFGIGWGNNWAFDPFYNGFGYGGGWGLGYGGLGYGYGGWGLGYAGLGYGYGGWGLGYGGWGYGYNSGYGNFPVAIINNPNYRPRPSRAEAGVGRTGNPNFPRQDVVQRDAAGNVLNTASRAQRWAETDRVSRSSGNGDYNNGRPTASGESGVSRPRPSRVYDSGSIDRSTSTRSSSAPRQSAPTRSSSPERTSRPERSSSQPQRSPERTYSPPPSSSRSGSSSPSSGGGGSSRSSGGGGSSRPSRAGGGR